MNSIMMKLSVRISDLDWERLISERAKIRAMLKNTLEDLSRGERKAIRKPIESLLKGGEELEGVLKLIRGLNLAQIHGLNKIDLPVRTHGRYCGRLWWPGTQALAHPASGGLVPHRLFCLLAVFQHFLRQVKQGGSRSGVAESSPAQRMFSKRGMSRPRSH
jgi:hypothetical protein